MTTPTPRTDAVETTCKYPESFHYYALLDHARQLERENAALRASNAELHRIVSENLNKKLSEENDGY